MAYDFTTLSPDDFEDLVADLLSQEWSVRLETFKQGKDRGIDLRHTRILAPAWTTIVQCKRYAPHKYAALLRAVKSERTKIAKLQPTRYVLATSVPLSPDNKDELLSILQPWCQSTADIYGAGELNGLLRMHPEVEKAHFKLWIGSTAVLERILHSRIFNRTQATIESTQEHLSRIVIHQGFDRALDLLHQNHHVLIVGNPGIGKTTMARVLLCHYLREGFEPICVAGDIDAAWDLIHTPSSVDRKVVVLYDDFLGRLKFDSVRFGKNEEFSLLEFLDKVKRSPNLRFIMTTREYILADAQRIHGAFASRAGEILKYTLRLDDYSKAHRAKMLFNHLYFSDLPDDRLAKLVKSRVYRDVVDHTHFNPRVVESISSYANSRTMTDDEYIEFIQQEFDNPAKVWEHPFRSDISLVARIVLLVLSTFNGTAEIEQLKAAIHGISEAKKDSEFALEFTEALRQLDGNFISTNRYPGRSLREGPFLIAEFKNPSVEEFVDEFLKSEPSLLTNLLQAIVCFRQASNMASRLSEIEKSRQVPKELWLLLRERAAAVESIPGGHLINYRPHGESVRRVWNTDDNDFPRVTRARFQIEAEATLNDEIQKQLQARVRTSDGWISLLHGFQNDDSHAYGVQHLHEWVQQESEWPEAIKTDCLWAFRRAVFLVIEDEDEVWACSLGSLRIFAELVLSDGIAWSEQEQELFRSACRLVSRTILDNDRAEEDVRHEADELSTIEKITKLPLKKEIEQLESRANDLSDSPRDRDVADPESRRIADPSAETELDVDALFASLLDR